MVAVPVIGNQTRAAARTAATARPPWRKSRPAPLLGLAVVLAELLASAVGLEAEAPAPAALAEVLGAAVFAPSAGGPAGAELGSFFPESGACLESVGAGADWPSEELPSSLLEAWSSGAALADAVGSVDSEVVAPSLGPEEAL